MREAIEGWREVEAILDPIQQLTRLRIFGSLPDVRRRKQLTKKVLDVKSARFFPDPAPDGS